MPDYEHVSRFYDAVMDDPAPRGARVRRWIERFHPDATSLLELGCGTGSILVQLADVAFLTGLDRSPEMLAVASEKVPRARLLQADMESFSLGERVDVVICMFDSLNHLLTFEAWQSVFDGVHDHLAEGGLFVFDVNTIGELRRLGEEPPWVYDFDDNVMIMDVLCSEDGLSEWDIRIFEHLGGSRYDLSHERIGELAVRLSRIRSALEPKFILLDEVGDSEEAPTDESVKAYFACRRRE